MKQREMCLFSKISLHFLTAVLYLIFISRKTLIQMHFAQDQLPDILQESYNKLVQIEKDFFHHGHKNNSAEILLECANIRR